MVYCACSNCGSKDVEFENNKYLVCNNCGNREYARDLDIGFENREVGEPVDLSPLGVVPKWIWLKQRERDILEAIERYTKAEILIPFEWGKELRELEEILKNIES